MLVLLLITGTALAAFPDDPPNDPGYDPAEEGGPETCLSESADAQQHYLFSFIPKCATNASDPEGSAGMSVDEAWREYTTGRPDTVIAYIEGGINWQDDPTELANKVFLNSGELPEPTTPVADGRLNAEDFADTDDSNGNGLVDGEDIIVRFSDGADDDGNGYTDDISGWDFYSDQNNPTTIDSAYEHANAQMEQAAAETDNANTEAGICPDCMVMPIKAGAEALDRTDDLAEAWLYAIDMKVDVLVSVTADLGYSSFMRQVVNHGWDRDVIMVEASNDFNSTDHQGGQYWPHVLPGNGLVSNVHGLEAAPPVQNPLIESFRARSGFTSWGTQNIFSASTKGGTTSEATPTIGGVLALVRAWGKEAAEEGLIDEELSAAETIGVVRATSSDVSGDTNWPSQPGFDLQFGYGRPEIPDAMAAISEGAIPPVAWFDGPRWYRLYDPTRENEIKVSGHLDAPRSDDPFDWKLQFAPGAEPVDDEFELAAGGSSTAPIDGEIGTIDLDRIPESFWSRAFELSETKTLETSERYTVTLRLQVTDSEGRVGEERRSIAVHHDPDWREGFPIRLDGPGGEAQPQLADLQGTGRLAMIFGDSDGVVHAIDPEGGSELEGWPAKTEPTVMEAPRAGIDPGNEPIINNVAVAPMSRSGRLSVAASTSTGRVYLWNDSGKLREGWPKKLDSGIVSPESPRPQLPFTRQPVMGASSPPIISDLDSDGDQDVIQAGWDGDLHAWDRSGASLEGFPLDVELPNSHAVPPEYLTFDDQKLSTSPAIADLDGDGDPEIVVKSQLTDTRGIGIQPVAFSHLHAYHHDGSVVDGWPIEVVGTASFAGSAQEFITEGANSPVAADVDGDGDDEIAFAPVLFSPTSLFDGDGTQIRTYSPVPGATLALLAGDQDAQLSALNGDLPEDTPVNFTTSGAFGKVGQTGTIAYAEPGSGAASVAGGLLLTGSGIPINNYLRAHDAATGATVPGFPSELQGLDFLGAPVIADVTGDGAAEVINGGDTSAIHAYGDAGTQVGGFPGFHTGWIIWGPSVGDLDSNGTNEVVANTRESYLFAWETKGSAEDGNSEWWAYRHDERNTARYGTDTRPPGVIRKPEVSQNGSKLRFDAPGDDWYSGTAERYEVKTSGGGGSASAQAPATADAPDPGPAGERQAIDVPSGARTITVQAVDDADNFGAPVQTAVNSSGNGEGGGGGGGGGGSDIDRSGSSEETDDDSTKSVTTASGDGSLPFTGLALGLLALIGLASLAAGKLVGRDARAGR